MPQEKVAAPKKPDVQTLAPRLHARQQGRCFICDEAIDLVLHAGQLDVDHIEPVAEGGPDDENNYALTHSSCNRAKGASDLRVARRMAQFERLQEEARKRGERGAHLGHVLEKYGGARRLVRFGRGDGFVDFPVERTGRPVIERLPLYRDTLSGMNYCFGLFPLEFLHHDDRINPRTIGTNVRGLLEEFMKKRPQLQVGLAWWAPEGADGGPIKVFDGQHKAAAQILLGVRELPLRVFMEPDLDVLLQANTNAGEKLRQVAFDAAVLRHLGSTLYVERVQQYQRMKGLQPHDYSFSEADLVAFFRGARREMQRYVVDAVRDSVTHNKDNRLMEFVEWSGKQAERPLSYSAIERTFFSQFIYTDPLHTPISEGMEEGDNARMLERDQLVRLMTMFADTFFVGFWDRDVGGRKIENRVQKGEPVAEGHLRAWRVAREEILYAIVEYVRLVIENYFAFQGEHRDRERLLHRALPAPLWTRLGVFLKRMAGLPCWVDRNLSNTVFGPKQTYDVWRTIFSTGRSPQGVQVLAKPLNVIEMVQEVPNR